MKIRNGFVSNSSSSSFICMRVGNREIIKNGSNEYIETDEFSVSLDYLIKLLQDAKDEGVTLVNFEYGGGMT
jgi:hypothetical protein